MDGVIIFADDNIFESTGFEYKLFKKFNEEKDYSIIPINNLTSLEKTITSISTYRAIILDWNFKRNSDTEGVVIEDENPLDLLESNNIYSLIYIYSEKEIGPETKDRLIDLYKDKIRFQIKINNDEKVKSEFDKIINDINEFNIRNQHLDTPFLWSKAINKSVQTIFRELEEADPNWIKEIYNTAKEDHSEPNIEVISVFQNLLNESIIQDRLLIEAITSSTNLGDVNVPHKDQSLAKLYNRVYYTKLVADAPLMTGDIFNFANNEYSILITPECDIISKKEDALEFLSFYPDGFVNYLLSKKKYNKTEFVRLKGKSNPKELDAIKKVFTNGEIKIHILPSFPFSPDSYSSSAFIDFDSAFNIKKVNEFKTKRTGYKLNSPFIHQLRQRYLAYIGRVGVPSIPSILKEYNLK
jgi:hypothetical protein